jgi:hypothetical protein
MSLIEQEIRNAQSGIHAEITCKVNGIDDAVVSAKLYEVSLVFRWVHSGNIQGTFREHLERHPHRDHLRHRRRRPSCPPSFMK